MVNRVKIGNDVELKDRLVAINRVTKEFIGNANSIHKLGIKSKVGVP